MVVTNIKEGGNFDSGLASWLLTDEATRNRLIQNIVDTAVEKNYYGVDIDFENVYGRGPGGLQQLPAGSLGTAACQRVILIHRHRSQNQC